MLVRRLCFVCVLCLELRLDPGVSITDRIRAKTRNPARETPNGMPLPLVEKDASVPLDYMPVPPCCRFCTEKYYSQQEFKRKVLLPEVSHTASGARHTCN